MHIHAYVMVGDKRLAILVYEAPATKDEMGAKYVNLQVANWSHQLSKISNFATLRSILVMPFLQ